MDWQKRKERILAKEKDAQKLFWEWLKDNRQWRGYLMFSDYPPQLNIYLTLDGVNTIGVARLEEISKMATHICNELGLTGRIKRHSHKNTVIATNEVVYILWEKGD